MHQNRLRNTGLTWLKASVPNMYEDFQPSKSNLSCLPPPITDQRTVPHCYADQHLVDPPSPSPSHVRALFKAQPRQPWSSGSSLVIARRGSHGCDIELCAHIEVGVADLRFEVGDDSLRERGAKPKEERGELGCSRHEQRVLHKDKPSKMMARTFARRARVGQWRLTNRERRG
ncbi:hypothetical protein NL676_037186 [Syzygium grande]|nr:hypothetical protein NL676_037186 [Syzygium grande]